MMHYNFYFEMAGALMSAILLYFLHTQYDAVSESLSELKKMVLFLVIAETMDIITALLITQGDKVSPDFNLVANTVYLIFSIMFLYQAAVYVGTYFMSKNAKIKLAKNFLYIGNVYLILLLVNLPLGILFSFNDQGQYIKGPLYFVEFLIPFIYIMYTFGAMVAHRKVFSNRQFHALIFFVVVAAGTSLVQFFWLNDVLLSFFGANIGVLIAVFSLETPDYDILIDTMDQLKFNKIALEEANAEAEIASQVKSDFLARMSHEIRTPINAMLGYSDMISSETSEEQIKEYARKSLAAGKSLLSLVDTILLYTDDNGFSIAPDQNSYLGEDDEKIQVEAPEAKILLVDDNQMNIDLVKGLLKDTHATIDTAYNGLEALDALRKNFYHLVFIDHMMPEMDGVTAFGHMIEENLVPDTPIIMLTANAIPGARDFYMEKGFDEYISKPVSQQRLFHALNDFLPENLVKKTGYNINTPDEEPDYFKKLTFLDTKTGLAYCADSYDFYLEMLNSFVDNDRTSTLEELYQEEKWEEYRITVHAIKSTSFSIGAIEISDDAKGIEMSLRENKLSWAKERHQDFLKEYSDLIHNIRQVIQ